MNKNENPNTKTFYDDLYKGTWRIKNVNIPFQYEEHGKMDFYKSLTSLSFFYSSGKLLDVGCGLGGLLASLPEDNKLEFFGIDFSTSAIDQISKRIKGNFMEGNVHKLPYEDNFFDRVVCTETLEHVDDPKKVIAEIFRVLKPNGKLLITVPEESKDLKNENWPGGISLHINKFNFDIINKMVMEVGLSTEFNEIVKNEIWCIAEKVLNEERNDDYNIKYSGDNIPQLKFLQVHTYYESYLQQFYINNPELCNNSYDNQIKALINDGFSGIHIIAPHMNELGYESKLIIANNEYAQSQWLKENNLFIEKTNEFIYKTLKLQIENIKPDILYLSDPITFDSKFIRQLNYKPKLIFGWRAADIPANVDWSEFDVILSGLSGVLQTAVQLGAKHSEYFVPGFPNLVAASSKNNLIYDVTFCGSWTEGQHKKRNALITTLAEYALEKKSIRLGLFINSANNNLPHPVAQLNRGPFLDWRCMMF